MLCIANSVFDSPRYPSTESAVMSSRLAERPYDPRHGEASLLLKG